MELKLLCGVLWLIKSSRWRKASKCKSLIKQLKKQIIIQKNRLKVIRRQLRADIAELLQNDQHKDAMSRVAQLYKDQCTLSAYDQLEEFCDCICTNCRNISSYSDLSADMREAVSSLIFAASRCGELPELHLLRKLFQRQFGQGFEKENVELLPGNAVNSRMKQNITTNSVTLDMKIQLLNEIKNEQVQYLEPPSKEQHLVPEVDTPWLSNNQETTVEQVCLGLSEEWNRTAVQKNSNKDSSGMTAANSLWDSHQTAIGCSDDDKEQSWSREDHQGRHGLDRSPSWVEKLSSMIYIKKVTTIERCTAFVKNDLKKATANRSLTPHHSPNELRIEGEEESRMSQTSHIHPKLPDYDDLVIKFKDLKQEYMQQNSDNRTLHKGMRW